jgi:hypothetical protein
LLAKETDTNQAEEQLGFRAGRSIVENIVTLKIVTEK